ncbi:UDP-glucuronate decarboxylase [Heracleum sosnowskyi]|uniref:UDP-glucuronate decarboxylase n=1 Tax=Heracleum sosnowskyi TaxID=360622 RepID=A0AAD8N2N2_9APIA|nr:UDP-glucuronate decarboxylase [Heracleum sosnowskyi]
MKQLHKQSSVAYKRDEELLSSTDHTSSYSPKALKHHRSFPRSINYLFKEQRLLFILLGILIGSTFFIIQPNLSSFSPSDASNSASLPKSVSLFDREALPSRKAYPRSNVGMQQRSGRIPVGIGRKRLRIVVTGGAGFVGSHLVDKLIARGDDVIVIDNFFTGRKDNVMHHFGNPRFEMIRHDVVEPILLEVDQIYHLACPASPVHYKYNPVKTIISFSWLLTLCL